jgi:hypothetical protein
VESDVLTKLRYAPINFLRDAPNTLLVQCFHRQSFLTDLDIATLEETKITPIFEAWYKLPEGARARIDRDFQEAHLMADEVGLCTILEEAHYYGEPLEDQLEELEGFYS